MFIDSVEITFAAGKGGNGIVAWRREKYLPKGGPYGGDGGKGGSIFLIADTHHQTLQHLRHNKLIKAEDGEKGGSNLCTGRNGKDLLIPVPCGTLILDFNTKATVCDLSIHGQKFLLCQGGKGGKGNDHFKSPTNRAPNVATAGTDGELKKVRLELKLIADVGFIGMPNAGKSTLLASLARIYVQVGNYPFTTLHPNLSFIEIAEKKRIYLADIPGIIQGAHVNRGLGLSFLKHVERTKALIFILDASGIHESDPLRDLMMLREEIALYKPEILEKPFVIALNKTDLDSSQEICTEFRNKLKTSTIAIDPEDIFEISALHETGLEQLKAKLEEIVFTDSEEPQLELALGEDAAEAGIESAEGCSDLESCLQPLL